MIEFVSVLFFSSRGMVAVAPGRGKMRRRGENRGNIQYNIISQLVSVSNGLLTYLDIFIKVFLLNYINITI